MPRKAKQTGSTPPATSVDEVAERVGKALSKGTASIPQLVSMTGLSRGVVERALEALANVGRISVDRKGRTRLFTLIDRGEAAAEPEEVAAVAEEMAEPASMQGPPAPAPQGPPPIDYGPPLPERYGVNKLVLMPRDPYWAYAYWEIGEENRRKIEAAYPGALQDDKLVLRFYDVTDIVFDGGNAHSHWDQPVRGLVGNWFVDVNRPGRNVLAEIGVLVDGRFLPMARSNAIRLPPDEPSDEVDEEWMIRDEEFQRLFMLSGGGQIGQGSADLHQYIKERMRWQLSSGLLTSSGLVR